jgi:hypothetical protein
MHAGWRQVPFKKRSNGKVVDRTEKVSDERNCVKTAGTHLINGTQKGPPLPSPLLQRRRERKRPAHVFMRCLPDNLFGDSKFFDPP